ncbi:MAG: hypothetical protein RJA09_999, partial [Pseudomonadota bacterium]
VSTSQRLGSQHIAPLLARLLQQHPGLDVWLELVDRRVDLLAEGFDMDIRVGVVQEPHLCATRIATGHRLLSRWDVALTDGRLARVLPQHRQPADIYAAMPTRSSQLAKWRVCLAFLSDGLRTGPWALDLGG